MKIVDDDFNELPWDGEAAGEVLIQGSRGLPVSITTIPSPRSSMTAG